MREITLENYRCFREQQTARLAPLTLLVGENSAGKTSFLAMIQVLLDMTYNSNAPNFKKSPYDLGSFDEIAHYRGGRGGRANTFKAGFSTCDIAFLNGGDFSETLVERFDVEFGRGSSTVPVPIYWCLSKQDAFIEAHLNKADNSFPHLFRHIERFLANKFRFARCSFSSICGRTTLVAEFKLCVSYYS